METEYKKTTACLSRETSFPMGHSRGALKDYRQILRLAKEVQGFPALLLYNERPAIEMGLFLFICFSSYIFYFYSVYRSRAIAFNQPCAVCFKCRSIFFNYI